MKCCNENINMIKHKFPALWKFIMLKLNVISNSNNIYTCSCLYPTECFTVRDSDSFKMQDLEQIISAIMWGNFLRIDLV